MAPLPAGDAAIILVVEDEGAVRRIIRRTLEREGFIVLEAAAAEDAVDLLASSVCRIDLLLTDLSLPGIGGIELAAQMHARDPFLPIMLMSGNMPEDSPTEDAEDFVQKPFTPQGLAEHVHRVLQRRLRVA